MSNITSTLKRSSELQTILYCQTLSHKDAGRGDSNLQLSTGRNGFRMCRSYFIYLTGHPQNYWKNFNKDISFRESDWWLDSNDPYDRTGSSLLNLHICFITGVTELMTTAGFQWQSEEVWARGGAQQSESKFRRGGDCRTDDEQKD